MTPEQRIIDEALELAARLPAAVTEDVADAIRTNSAGQLRAEITRRVAHHHYRDLALDFIDRWLTEAPAVDHQLVAVALQTASMSESRHRESLRLELVWTGPEVGGTSFRRTEQVVLQLLDQAKERILLVSYAVYRIPNIRQALVNAAKRGVRITVVIETPDRVEGEGEYDTLRALGNDVAAAAAVYYWPRENRKPSENEKVGLLHVKCVVADGKQLFLSSANLTRQAFSINMELGVLIRNGPAPGQVEGHFDALIREESLRAI